MCSGPKWKRENVPDHKVGILCLYRWLFIELRTPIIVWLCRYPGIHRQWFYDAVEVGLNHNAVCVSHWTNIFRYIWLYVIVLTSFLVYVSDIFSAITMLTTKNWSNEIFRRCANIDGCVFIPFNIGKWIFFGCIIFSFLLVRLFCWVWSWYALLIDWTSSQLAYESRKAKKIIASRDISFAFTNVLANNYYSLRSLSFITCFWLSPNIR